MKMTDFTVKAESWQNTLECVVHEERLRELHKFSLEERRLLRN